MLKNYIFFIFCVFKLIKEYEANEPNTVKIFNLFDLHFLVMTNPDGYQYSYQSPVFFFVEKKFLIFLKNYQYLRKIDFGEKIWPRLEFLKKMDVLVSI
jgi:hypothetical protein